MKITAKKYCLFIGMIALLLPPGVMAEGFGPELKDYQWMGNSYLGYPLTVDVAENEIVLVLFGPGNNVGSLSIEPTGAGGQYPYPVNPQGPTILGIAGKYRALEPKVVGLIIRYQQKPTVAKADFDKIANELAAANERHSKNLAAIQTQLQEATSGALVEAFTKINMEKVKAATEELNKTQMEGYRKRIEELEAQMKELKK